LAERQPAKTKLWFRLAQVLKEIGDRDREIGVWNRILEIDNQARHAHERLADLYCSLGRCEEALRHLRFIAEEEPQDIEPWRRLAQALETSGKREEAVVVWRRVLDIDPSARHPHERLAELHLAPGQIPTVVPHLNFMTKLEPTNIDWCARLSELQDESGDWEKAVEFWNQILQIHEDSRQAHERLGDLYLSQGRRQDALRHLRFLADRALDEVNPRIKLARLLQEMDDKESEIAVWNDVLKINSGLREARGRLIELYLALGRPTEALPHLRFIADSARTSTKSWVRLAKVLEDVGQHAQAIEVWNRAIRLIDRGWREAHERLAELNLMFDQRSEALSHLHSLAHIESDDLSSHAALLALLRKAGDAEEERLVWKKILFQFCL
jgi:tetratricopeptide (TPR) repeat protein